MEQHGPAGAGLTCLTGKAPYQDVAEKDSTKEQWSLVVETRLGGDALAEVEIRGPKDMEPPPGGKERDDFDKYVSIAIVRLMKSLVLVWDRDPSMEAVAPGLRLDFSQQSMAIEGDIIVANPGFVCDHEPEAIAVVIQHEYRHIQHEDMIRGRILLQGLAKNEPREVWRTAFNAGADLEINAELLPTLEKAGLKNMSLIPGYGDYAALPPGLKAEEYARRIMATPELRADMEARVARNNERLCPETEEEVPCDRVRSPEAIVPG